MTREDQLLNRSEIIRMAREAGLFHFYDSEGHCTGITDARLITESKERNDDRLVEMLTPFAALVAAASASVERETCARMIEHPDNRFLATEELAEMIREHDY